MLTAEEAREIWSYDPETGELRWKIKPCKNVKVGSLISAIRSGGYVHGMYKGKVYLAHRVAWLLVHGEWPDAFIDHINGERSDNRLVNLRLASRSENQCNSKRSVANTSGYKGVYYHKGKKSWVSKIRFNGKQHWLGVFKTPEEAYEAYKAAADRLHGEFKNYG